MSYSFTSTETKTFTVTHARHLAAKVSTDLKRLQRFYGYPSDTRINQFEDELIKLLKAGYLKTVTYGFKRDGKWIEPTLIYTSEELISSFFTDDDPGKVRPGKDTTGATFYSYLTYSSSWDNATKVEKEDFEKGLPFQRTNAPESAIDGYLEQDRMYPSGGRALNRSSVRGYN